MPEFSATTYIHAPVERVWAFHEAPEALETLTPPSQKIKVLSRKGGLEKGSRVVLQAALLGMIPTEWHAVHTECRKPNLFVDEAVEGPFRLWRHSHRMEASNAGTQLTDEIEFELPGGGVDQFAAGSIRADAVGQIIPISTCSHEKIVRVVFLSPDRIH